MLVDTHTHLQMSAFDADRDAVIERAATHGVTRLVVIGTDLDSSRAAVELAERYPGRLYATVGVHPHEATSLDDGVLGELRALAARPEVTAIGECGLDFYRDHSPREAQREAFRRQQALALELGLPLVVHSRGALDDCYQELQSGGGLATRVVMHCFTTSPEALEPFVEAACFIGMDGPVTYPKARDAQAIARAIPLDRLLLETDCPYLAPQQFRGRRCEPWHIAPIAERIAELRGLEVAEVAAATSANAGLFYGWDST